MAPEPKQLFRNNTAGWLGVTIVAPNGAPEGAAVEPGGTVWLTEQEARLTAHAPRMAADNPFLEQTYEVRDPETGETTELKLTPLTIVEDDRPGPPSERFVPSEVGTGVGVSSAPKLESPPPEKTQTATAQPPPSGPPPGLVPPPPPVPPGVRAAIENTEKEAEDVPEETAVATPEGEETGAAVEPGGPPPEGEFAVHEEVGTPDAPKPFVEV